jgi:Protein of unknown function (DUF1360)
MTALQFIISVLVTWRVVHIVIHENLPKNVMGKIREKLKVSGLISDPEIVPGSFRNFMTCFLCMSVWVAAPMAWYYASNTAEFFMYLFAISAAAIFVNTVGEQNGL